MGWSDRTWYLGPHRAAVFDRRGNGGPTVWWDGRVVGGWAQRNSGEIAFRLLQDVGVEGVAAVQAAAAATTSGRHEVTTRLPGPRRDRPAVRQDLAAVVEEHDAVAQPAPPLLGVAGHDAGGIAVGGVSGRAGWAMLAHDGSVPV
jgi:hypothetical protein